MMHCNQSLCRCSPRNRQANDKAGPHPVVMTSAALLPMSARIWVASLLYVISHCVEVVIIFPEMSPFAVSEERTPVGGNGVHRILPHASPSQLRHPHILSGSVGHIPVCVQTEAKRTRYHALSSVQRSVQAACRIRPSRHSAGSLDEILCKRAKFELNWIIQADLHEMEPRLLSTQKDVEDMMIRIDVDKAAAAETKVIVEKEEAEAQAMASATKAIADDAEKDLSEALPALELAVACLSKLKKVWMSLWITQFCAGNSYPF